MRKEKGIPKRYKQFSLSIELLQRLEDYADQQGMWESAVVTKALNEYFNTRVHSDVISA